MVGAEVFIDFFVKFFDPKLSGFVTGHEFEAALEVMFDNGTDRKKDEELQEGES